MRMSVKIKGAVIIILAILTILIWCAVLREDRHNLLTVSFLDVGQGDAIFIDAPSGRQVLIDGGRGSSVLRALSKAMPWWDRTIDMVVATHPDEDHIGGLVNVLARYKVSALLHSNVRGDTSTAEAFREAMKNEGAEIIIATRGQILDLGNGVYLRILFPDREVPNVATNTGSIVAQLVYGDTSLMLTGDSPDEVEEYLIWLDGDHLHSNVLKVGHHGSKTSSSLSFLGFVDPEYGIFSRGCDNKYGHPALEVVDRFEQLEILTRDTCTAGTITFVSDGSKVSEK